MLEEYQPGRARARISNSICKISRTVVIGGAQSMVMSLFLQKPSDRNEKAEACKHLPLVQVA